MYIANGTLVLIANLLILHLIINTDSTVYMLRWNRRTLPKLTNISFWLRRSGIKILHRYMKTMSKY